MIWEAPAAGCCGGFLPAIGYWLGLQKDNPALLFHFQLPHQTNSTLSLFSSVPILFLLYYRI
ncbi:hypothetical protein CYJ37_21690 [Bacillus sp. UMB0728]|nr:hypothetical protein B9K06_10305 [Bacillus sp. OG2]PLR70642.1 hypothetical protein CYJ37_21690 [Bacillus sp. UMB0728]